MPKCESEVISKWGAYNGYQPLLDRAEITTSPSSLSTTDKTWQNRCMWARLGTALVTARSGRCS